VKAELFDELMQSVKSAPKVVYVVIVSGQTHFTAFPSRRAARDWAHENVTAGYSVRRATLKLFES